MTTQAHNWPMPHSEIVEMLHKHQIMPTNQRLQIAELLFEAPQHLSAEQLMERLKDQQKNISKATVYNTLGLFARKGILKPLPIDPERVLYDSNTSHHHHFYNVDTGELTDIDEANINIAVLPNLPENTQVDSIDVIIQVRGNT